SENVGAHLRAAARAPHRGVCRKSARDVVVSSRDFRFALELRAFLHEGELSIARHELAVDAILPSPDPSPFDFPWAARRDRISIARRDDGEKTLLRTEAPRLLPGEDAPQVLLEDGPLAHREDAGLLARMRH